MLPLTPTDVVNIAQYERERPAFLARIIELKKRRRAQAGDLVTLVFENRDTVRFQVQEMMRAKRIVNDERIREELDAYNRLIPGPNALSATLLIEVTDRARLREALDRFTGIDHGGTTFLVFGGERVEAQYEGGGGNESRVSAVHYLTFTLSDAQAQAIVSGESEAAVEIAHNGYAATAALSPETLASLAEDLRSG